MIRNLIQGIIQQMGQCIGVIRLFHPTKKGNQVFFKIWQRVDKNNFDTDEQKDP